jgi:hypothetical protein
MGKTYTVAFDSTLSYGGANNNKRTYYTNWSALLPKDTAFNVTFSFTSADVVYDAASPVLCLSANLGQTCAVIASSTAFRTSNVIGSLQVDSSTKFYYASTTTNPPIYIKTLPSVTFLEVELHNGLTGANFNTPVPADYVLMLSFEECDHDQ